MRWSTSFATLAGVVVGLVQAKVPEALSEAFVPGQSLSVKFGDTAVQDGGSTSAGSLSSSPVFTISSPDSPIPSNTLYTVVLLDITDSRDPTAEAVLHYAASNLRAPSSQGGELGSGTVDFRYVPPSAGSSDSNYVFLAYSQQDGDIRGLKGLPSGNDKFSVTLFRQNNEFQLADSGLQYIVSSAATTSLSSFVFSFQNTTSTTFPSSTSVESSTSDSSPSPTPAPPQDPITSYLTLDVGGSTRTVVYTRPNDPGSTLVPMTSSLTSANPSLITGGSGAESHKAASRGMLALVGAYIGFMALI